ncbi:MAG TPA: Gfo/Idh/MocA family oxidoreductase [Gaiellaceae bacterium]|nr:Gfo/Idh/MocA family oxidoreductase [Gaiellaceae bacterium]
MTANVALVGYGLAGSVFHAPFIATTPGLRLSVVVTGDERRREQALREHPSVDVVGTADEVWERAPELDVAVIATPNDSHARLGLAALEARLAVVVDKPLALNAVEGARLVDAAAERRLMLTVFQNRRWDGDFLTLRRLLEASELGRVHRFESRFERWRPKVGDGWRERRPPEEGGGLLLDLGSHLVDQALQLFGPARGLYAEVDARREGAVADDDVFLALEHESGVRSHLWASVLAAEPGPRFRVLGDRAAFVKEGLDVQEERLRAGRSPTDPGWGEEPRERWGRLVVGEAERDVPTEPGSYEAFYAGVVASLNDGAPPPVDPRDAVAVLELLDEARAG